MSRPPSRPSGSGAVQAGWGNAANAFTLLRVALVPVIVVLLLVGGDAARWWAFGVFLFAAFTDFFDGWLARRLVGPTRWGALADPAADKLLIIGLLAVLALLGEVPWWAVAVVVVREAAVTAERSWLARRDVVMPASVFGKWKTVTQIAAVALFLMPAAPPTVETVVLWIAVAATVASGLEYAFRGRRLLRG